MKIGRIEQLTTHIKNELKAIEAHIESWKWSEIQERDTEVARLNRKVEELHFCADENRRLLSLFRSMWAIVMNDTPGPPPVDVALDELEGVVCCLKADRERLNYLIDRYTMLDEFDILDRVDQRAAENFKPDSGTDHDYLNTFRVAIDDLRKEAE